MRTFLLYAAACAAGLVFLSVPVASVQAETVISNGYLGSSTVWDADGSPYVLQDSVTVPTGVSLTIRPGVEITADTSLPDVPAIYVNGSLSIAGTAEHPVTVRKISGITIDHGALSMNHSDIEVPDGVSLIGALATISTSTVSHAAWGIHSKASSLTVNGSQIRGNDVGIFVESPGRVFQVRAAGAPDTGGIGNALLADATAHPVPDQVTVSNSSITNNSHWGIQNAGTTTVDASHNWWGNTDGPRADAADGISGPVDVDPWLASDPTATSSACCSSILFIPGFEGSRLFIPGKSPITGQSPRRLWEPKGRDDIAALYLDSKGRSLNDVYSGGPIDTALGITDIYGTFMKFLGQLVASGTIAEWRPFGYDWRMSVADIVKGDQKKATTTENLADLVSALALRSKTGKVTIVAHSNGGLIAKYLAGVLASQGKSDLIDTVVSVGVPYLGTPEALLGLLYGENQSIAHGLIASASTMRTLAHNMPSAYALLPSGKYYDVIGGDAVGPASSTLNALLLTAADRLHSVLDALPWPGTVAEWSLVGWGIPTTRSVEYHRKTSCAPGGLCMTKTAHAASTTLMGDGTVVAPSAAYDAGTVIALDLTAVSKADDRSIRHATLLESSTTESVIRSIIGLGVGQVTGSVTADAAKLPGVSVGDPDAVRGGSFIVLRTHSPVDLNVYDSQGRHTGPVPIPDSLAGPDSLYVGAFEEGIPGSRFDSVGGSDDDPEYQAYLPVAPDQSYSVVLNGTGLGTFGFDESLVTDGSVVSTASFTDLPVTPLSVASTTINVVGYDGSVSISTSMVSLTLDIDGDGSADIKAASGTTSDLIMSFEMLKKTLRTIAGNLKSGQGILKRIDALEALAKAGKLKRLGKVSDRLQKRIAHLKTKKLGDADKQGIIDLIDAFVRQFE